MEESDLFETRRWETSVSRDVSGAGMELDGEFGREEWLSVGGDIDIVSGVFYLGDVSNFTDIKPIVEGGQMRGK